MTSETPDQMPMDTAPGIDPEVAKTIENVRAAAEAVGTPMKQADVDAVVVETVEEAIETSNDVEIVPGETEPETGTMDEDARPTELAVYNPNQMTSTEALTIADMAIRAVVAGTENMYETAIKIMRGHELGLPPIASIENLYVVSGRSAMGAGLVATLIKKSGQYNYKVKDHDDKHCEIEFFEKGFIGSGEDWESVGVASFSVDEAKTAGLVKPGGAWLTYPKNMVFARALTNGARFYCPDVFQGSVYTPEELRAVEAVPAPPIAGAPAPPAAAAPTQSRASTTQAPTAASPTVTITPQTAYIRPVWADGVDWSTEECPLHFADVASLANAAYKGQQKPVNYYKGGRMKSHAHNTGEGWCNRDEVIRDLREKVETVSEGHHPQFNAFIDAGFTDIATVDPNDWRAGDWYAILERLTSAKLTDQNVPDTSDPAADAVEGDTGEELPV